MAGTQISCSRGCLVEPKSSASQSVQRGLLAVDQHASVNRNAHHAFCSRILSILRNVYRPKVEVPLPSRFPPRGVEIGIDLAR